MPRPHTKRTVWDKIIDFFCRIVFIKERIRFFRECRMIERKRSPECTAAYKSSRVQVLPEPHEMEAWIEEWKKKAIQPTPPVSGKEDSECQDTQNSDLPHC